MQDAAGGGAIVLSEGRNESYHSIVGAGVADRDEGPRRAVRFIASRIATMSASTAPSAQAAYTVNMVVRRWPCSFATNRGLRPIIKLQLTEVWRAT